MDEKEYQHGQMLHEYNSLREEILQLYDHQMNLIFGAAITVAGALLVTLIQSQAILAGLPILFAVLIGICLKSIANYNRIFRIGSYLTVVHEQQGKPEAAFRPGPEKIAWHTRWRRVHRNEDLREKVPWVGAEAPQSEAVFLGLLGIAGWGLAAITLKENLVAGIMNFAVFTLSVLLTLSLFYFLYRLRNVRDVSKDYEEVIRLLLEKDVAES